jgi:hypothetical protein
MPGSWVGRHYPDIGLYEDIAPDRRAQVVRGDRQPRRVHARPCGPRDLLHYIVDLVPKLQRRGRFRNFYTGPHLARNLAG